MLAASIVASASVATPALANSAAAASDAFRVKPEDVASNKTALGVSDPEFRALHDGWGQMNGIARKSQVAVPSINPVESMRMTSQYGYRTDPVQGRRKNHKGLDIAGPIGAPIYATADGIIGRAQWVSGYGKYVEVEHGNAIQTRYGHLSAMNVYSGQRVRKGDVIGFMGSTGRSTGSHLHYEVRIAGEPVNPTSFLEPAAKVSNILIASKDADTKSMGGPAE
ncbi:MAG: M23 family metallopeptidase [Sphingomonadales bacterium]|nr:M23 family metallopeptidase [Sphingomonadales bacterium]